MPTIGGWPGLKVAALVIAVFAVAFILGYSFGYYDAVGACSGTVGLS